MHREKRQNLLTHQKKSIFINLKVDSDLSLFEDDDDKPRISWRGDGQFFVVSSVTSQGMCMAVEMVIHAL